MKLALKSIVFYYLSFPQEQLVINYSVMHLCARNEIDNNYNGGLLEVEHRHARISTRPVQPNTFKSNPPPPTSIFVPFRNANLKLEIHLIPKFV